MLRIGIAAKTTISKEPLRAFTPGGFSSGYWPFRSFFRVDRPPHQEGGQWRMTVDGVDLLRSEPPPAANLRLLLISAYLMRRLDFEKRGRLPGAAFPPAGDRKHHGVPITVCRS